MEDLKDQLSELCYKGAKGDGEGEWGPACDNVLAQNPTALKGFFQERERVKKAMGDGRYMLNPVVALCPFQGCRQVILHPNQMRHTC